tara:strand:+ start:998 stop:1261 length:264 start_codon:yes stop_codon:yes gene_type:complete
MEDNHGERLARIEEAIKGLGRSVDTLRDNFTKHDAEGERLEHTVAAVKEEMALVRGGLRMFWKMLGGFAIVSAAAWSVAAWVTKNGN